MSVLIKDMEIPEHCGYCRFRYDGICHALQKTQYSVTECPLVSVPTPHEPEDWMERNKERILQAGMEGREFEFRIGGRLFAIREKAQ